MQSMYQLFDKQGVCWGYVLTVAVWLSTHYSCGGGRINYRSGQSLLNVLKSKPLMHCKDNGCLEKYDVENRQLGACKVMLIQLRNVNSGATNECKLL